MSEPILKVKGLKVHFPVSGGFLAKKQIVKAVDGVDFEIAEGETFGLVGESGCGKSTTGRALVKIYEPTAGSVIFEGEDITKIKGAKLKKFRQDMQMIFQDPYASLNPRMTVGEIIREPMDIHGILNTKEERETRVRELLEIVGLKPDHIRRYPHEFSGGQRQRAWIAMTLAQETEIIMLDEPTTYLDMSYQLEVLEVLQKLNKEKKITVVIVLHELNNACRFADNIIGLKKGKIICEGRPLDVINKENLNTIYGIDANLTISEDGKYPICMEYDLFRGINEK